MNQTINVPKWWVYSTRTLLILTLVVSLLCLIFLLARHSSLFGSLFSGLVAAIFGNDALGQSLGLGIIFSLSYYVISDLLMISMAGFLIGYYFKYPLNNMVVTFSVSLATVLSTNAYL